MCRAAPVLLAGLLALSGTATAQESAALRARISRLERALAVAERTARRIDSLEHAGPPEPLDTIVAGGLRVFVPSDVRPQAEAAAARVWLLLDSTFGRAAADGPLSGRTFRLFIQRDDAVPDARGVAHAVLANATATDMTQRLLWRAATTFAARGDSALREWLGGALMPEPDPRREPRGVYTALVTAPSPAVRHCYGGDLRACGAALGFATHHEALSAWYAPDRRRAIVRELAGLEPVRRTPGTARACLDDGSDADCLALLQSLPAGAVPRPLPAAARFSLVRQAVALGGRGAYARLLDAAGRPMDERLAAASGVPVDSLLAAWRAAILAARPRPVTVEPRGAWVALVWGVVFGLLALRSSRWR